jgi:hypothetical protein
MFSLLSLLDDIATTMDDVAVMSKIAIKKTSALMSDDLAVNAGAVHGVSPSRELPIVKSIFLGSLLNKAYCIFGVLVLMATYPPLINMIMFMGGLYLSYEGVHKILDKVFHKSHEIKKRIEQVSEKEKIKGAVRTDLILSIEIIVIAKSTLTGSLPVQIITLIAVGIAASVIIYGLVALLVKIDDLGLNLIEKGYKRLGLLFVSSMPYIMKGLGIIGTIAMLLVGGGIIAHIFHLDFFNPEFLQNLIVGFFAGLICVLILSLKFFIPKST